MPVSITFRTAGAWGAGNGADLTAAQVDTNFSNLRVAVKALQANPAEPNQITNITASGATLTIHLADGTTYAVDLPVRTSPPPQLRGITATTFTPALQDANTYLRCTNAAGCAVTVPDDAAVNFDVGTELHFRQAAAGAVAVAGAGVTINVPSGYLAQTDRSGAVMTLKKVSTNQWDLLGMLEPTP